MGSSARNDLDDSNKSGEGALLKTSLKVTLAKIAGSFLGFCAIVLIAHRFGTGHQADALFIGRIIPLMLAAQIGRALSVALVPILTEVQTKEGTKTCRALMGRLVIPAGIFLGLFALAYYFLSPFLMRIIGAGFDAETLVLSNRVTRVLSLSIFFLGGFFLLEAFLNVHRIFLVPEILAGLLPLGTICGVLILANDFGIVGVPIGTVGGGLVMFLILWSFVRIRFKVQILNRFTNLYPFLKRAFAQIVPVLWGTSAGQISTAVARAFATTLGSGRVSVLSYGHRVCTGFPYLWGLAIGKVLLPHLCEQAVAKGQEDLKKSVTVFIRVMLLLFVPYSAALIILSLPLTALIFGHGAFTEADVHRTASVISYYAPAITFGAINLIAMRTFFSLQRASIIFITATVFLLTSVALSLILMRYLGVQGLALAYSLALFAQMSLVLSLLAKEIGNFFQKDVFIFALKVMLAAGVSSGIVHAFLLVFQFPYDLKTAFLLCLFGIVMITLFYVSILWYLKIPEVIVLLNVIRRRPGLCLRPRRVSR